MAEMEGGWWTRPPAEVEPQPESRTRAVEARGGDHGSAPVVDEGWGGRGRRAVVGDLVLPSLPSPCLSLSLRPLVKVQPESLRPAEAPPRREGGMPPRVPIPRASRRRMGGPAEGRGCEEEEAEEVEGCGGSGEG